ncbi:MAG TPA: glycosyltransferase family 39 protein [Gaiellaceae bacterium]
MVVAVGMGVLAFAVRIEGALNFAFWQDEVGAAEAIVHRTPLGVARHVARIEGTPPMFYELGWAVHKLGLSPEHVRIVSALAGALLAGGLVVYARRLVPLWASALAGLLVALGYQFVFHGRELRSYELHALMCFALAVAALAFVGAPSRGRWLALAFVVAVGALTNYFFLLSVATVLLWLWVSQFAGRVRVRATWAVAAGLLPFVAWLPVMARQYGHRDVYSYISSFQLDEVLDTPWHLFARAAPQAVVLRSIAPLLLLGAVLAGCVLLARRSDGGRLTALLAVVPMLIASLIWLAGPHIYTVRNLIGTGPFAAVALAAVVASVRLRVAALAAVAAASLMVYGYVRNDRVRPVPYDDVARALVAERWTPADVIVLDGNFYAFRGPIEWYLPGRPRLALGELRGHPCRRLFVVATEGSPWNTSRPALPLEEARRVRGILVARIGPSGTARSDRLPRGGRPLVSAKAPPRCARAVPEGQLVSRIRASAPAPALPAVAPPRT